MAKDVIVHVTLSIQIVTLQVTSVWHIMWYDKSRQIDEGSDIAHDIHSWPQVSPSSKRPVIDKISDETHVSPKVLLIF